MALKGKEVKRVSAHIAHKLLPNWAIASTQVSQNCSPYSSQIDKATSCKGSKYSSVIFHILLSLSFSFGHPFCQNYHPIGFVIKAVGAKLLPNKKTQKGRIGNLNAQRGNIG